MTDSRYTPLEMIGPRDELDCFYDQISRATSKLGKLAMRRSAPKNLESFRFGVSGDDDAVDEIGKKSDRRQLDAILKNPV